MSELYGDNWVLDPEQKLHLLKISKLDKMIFVGRVEKFGVLRTAYMIRSKFNTYNIDANYIDTQLKHVCVEGSKFYEYAKKELNIERVDVRSHHNIVDGKLC